MSIDSQQLLDKYKSIIQEEVNVKEISLLPDDIDVQISYAPIGSQLAEQFGKQTGQIIAAAKQGNVTPQPDGSVLVNHGEQQRQLSPEQFEVRYHGLEESHQTVQQGVIVDLDLHITDELKAEGIAREISRFLNQMRKDADFAVNDRVTCRRQTDLEELQTILSDHTDYLVQEALLSEITQGDGAGEIQRTFECEL